MKPSSRKKRPVWVPQRRDIALLRAQAAMAVAPERLRQDRPWKEYPMGTKAHAYDGGYWIRVFWGWKWHASDTFPTPGGSAVGACIELPTEAVAPQPE